MNRHRYKALLFLSLLLVLLCLPVSCSKQEEKKKEVSFEICKETELPDELRRLIEEKKEEPFRFTYENSAYLYLAVGYGIQPEGEYVVCVESLTESEAALYVDTVLISMGHGTNRKIGTPSSYPYVILRCKKNGKRAVFLS